MKPVTLAAFLLGLASVAGCSSDTEALKKAQAEGAAAKEELTKVKAEADATKAELALLKAQLAGAGGKSSPVAEEAVSKAARDFFLDLSQSKFRSAYEMMSVGYKMRVERKAFDEFLEKHPGPMNVARDNGFGQPEYQPIKIRKLAKDNAYECDCQTSYIKGAVYISNFTLRLVHEEGAWKIDDFLEIKDRKQ